MTRQPEIRPCTASELSTLLAQSPTRLAEHLRHRFSMQVDGAAELILAWRAGTIAGRMSLLTESKYAEIRRLHPGLVEINDFEAVPAGTGTGTAMLHWAHDHVAALGRRWIGLGVADTNSDATRLYRRNGYRDTGLRLVDEWTERGDTSEVIAEHANPIGYLVRSVRLHAAAEGP